jgi:glycosyltransferase involved in cell wall biosynthesis
MALRVPVVARRVGGIGSALDDGTAGILIASKEASAFLDGLNQLRCDKLYSEQLKAAAWLQVNRQFSVQHMADQYTSIYLQK